MDVTDDELTTVSQLNALFRVSALLIPGFQYLPETKQEKNRGHVESEMAKDRRA
jgi:hypothetical protein